MSNRKVGLSLSFTALGIILIFVFWKNTILLSTLLLITTYLKHKLVPIKREFLWFVITGTIGIFGESFIMTSGPWSYARPSIINFPLWLFFLWGYAGTLGISLYQGITK